MKTSERIKTLNFTEDIIAEAADMITGGLSRNPGGRDFSRTAVVFGGKRPALYLNRELARRLKSAFIPPAVFSMDEFVGHIAGREALGRAVSELDAGILMYHIAAQTAPEIIKERNTIARFLPWSREILSFIDELDVEDIDEQKLLNVKNLAGIGFDVPASINGLLKNIGLIKKRYHQVLEEKNLYSRGMVYTKAAKLASGSFAEEFENVLFCGLYYLHQTEKQIVKALDKAQKAYFIFQKDQNDYPALSGLEDMFNKKLKPSNTGSKQALPKILRGADTHTQIAQVKEILKDVKDPESCVVVLPDTSALVPLLYEIPDNITDFNVSAGYPFSRTGIYGLLSSIIEAQNTKKGKLYYAKDYLRILLHPLIKNIAFRGDPNITRVFVHKIEESLLGMEKSSIEKSLFAGLSDIENNDGIIGLGVKALDNFGIKLTNEEAVSIIKGLHDIAFRKWESIKTLRECAEALKGLAEEILNKGIRHNYPFSIKSYDVLFGLVEEIESSEYKDLPMSSEDVQKIFIQKLDSIVMAFSGSPLKGLQILGLYETRALSFKTAVVVDVNESKIPHLKVAEPLIPRQVMIALGLNRIEREEEIQRYHFFRLLGSAEEVYLLYNDSLDSERSRFLEELIWENEKKLNSKYEPVYKKRVFKAETAGRVIQINKNDKIAAFLADFTFSPTSLDVYLNCPLSFYYRYVLGLEEKAELLEEPEAREIGSFLHELLEKSFVPVLNQQLNINADFEARFYGFFEKLFNEKLKPRLSSEYFLAEDVLRYRLKQFLANEKKRGVKRVLALETDACSRKIKLLPGEINFTARIDRIDELSDGSILIVDYKTGSMPESPAGVERLSAMPLDRKSIKENIRSFQLPIYYYLAKDGYPGREINACLYGLKDLGMKYFIKQKEYGSAGDIEKICLNSMGAVISELLDKDAPFEQDAAEDSCRYCQYKSMCK
ncbi:MAG TPA: PD-(D/E)XK nuclease family protein [Firmicutes bacterium]|nr:PD-(D/E)XK nuclease family protein [Bacillota bacterium]